MCTDDLDGVVVETFNLSFGLQGRRVSEKMNLGDRFKISTGNVQNRGGGDACHEKKPKQQRFVIDDGLTMAPTLYVAAGVSVWL